MAVCTVGECSSRAHARGLCNRHYLRWWNHGDPEAPILKPGTPLGSIPWNKGRTPVRVCEVCGEEFTAPGRPTQRLCSQRCNGQLRTGDQNINWNGGTTDTYEAERHSWPARKWRRAVLERDHHTCQGCGATGVPLHADHIRPWATHPELRFELDNGRALCVPCHEATPTFGNGAKTVACG